MKFLVFLGSVRESAPPRPQRLGLRVAKAITAQLAAGIHSVNLIDPLAHALDMPFKPHFAYAKGKAPQALEEIAQEIESADGYVMLSPEYNHAMSPALANLLNHFGSSLFAYKPSVIATYSAGQWGGTRAAVNMRTFLSELGCLPVSAMIHVPKAQEIFDDHGGYLDPADASGWSSYFDRSFSQLEWWAAAAANWRKEADGRPEAFVRDPSQRNAP
jgi:chromate reductase, NAD(P)H dehydrogenase (quinone)